MNLASPYRWNARSKLAPIALFVYNRLEHTQKTVNSLRENDLAPQSDLLVFSDGAKNEAESAAVQQVRRYIRTIAGFKSATIIERDQNLGLARSVIAGVTQLCNDYGRVIVVEDDLLTSADFLTFLNHSLEQYKDEPSIFSVSGFNFPITPLDAYSCDAYCSYRSSSWGWGTWKDRWEKADWAVSDYAEFRADKGRRRLFNRGGEDLSRVLDLQMAGTIDSWSIRWDYAHFKHDAFALLPTVSRVYNIGFDGSGVHCRLRPFGQSSLVSEVSEAIEGCCTYRFPRLATGADPYFVAEIQRLHRLSIARKLVWFCKVRRGWS